MMAAIDWVHVPYRASFVPDLLAGQVQIAFTPISVTIGRIKQGKLRALARRHGEPVRICCPHPCHGRICAPLRGSRLAGHWHTKNTSVEIVEILSKAIGATFADYAAKARLVALGFEPVPMDAEEFCKLIADETEKWAKVVQAANFKPE
jgi:tripartite-type tricarboxylate transporter receptor subunit TctC